MEEDREPLLTCHRDDAYNQVKKRSKADHNLKVDKGRQNCVKVIDSKNKINKVNNKNVSSVAKRTENKIINSNEHNSKSGVRRSPRSPVVAKSRTPNSRTRNSSHNSHSSTNDTNSKNRINLRRSNSRSGSKPVENGNQTNGPNVSNANRRNR